MKRTNNLFFLIQEVIKNKILLRAIEEEDHENDQVVVAHYVPRNFSNNSYTDLVFVLIPSYCLELLIKKYIYTYI